MGVMTGVGVMRRGPGGHRASNMIATMPGNSFHAANDDTAEMAVGFRRPRHSLIYGSVASIPANKRTGVFTGSDWPVSHTTNSKVRRSQVKCCMVICALSEVCNGTAGRCGNGAGMVTQHAAHRAAAYERGPAGF